MYPVFALSKGLLSLSVLMFNKVFQLDITSLLLGSAATYLLHPAAPMIDSRVYAVQLRALNVRLLLPLCNA